MTSAIGQLRAGAAALIAGAGLAAGALTVARTRRSALALGVLLDLLLAAGLVRLGGRRPGWRPCGPGRQVRTGIETPTPPRVCAP